MITACELHERILIKEEYEKRQKEIMERVYSKQIVQEIISPLLDRLTEMPKDYFIGYVNDTLDMLYKAVEKKEGTTCAGNYKWEKVFSGVLYNHINERILSYANEILEEYGFVLNIKESYEEYLYYDSNKVTYSKIFKKLVLNTLCPFI